MYPTQKSEIKKNLAVGWLVGPLAMCCVMCGKWQAKRLCGLAWQWTSGNPEAKEAGALSSVSELRLGPSMGNWETQDPHNY